MYSASPTSLGFRQALNPWLALVGIPSGFSEFLVMEHSPWSSLVLTGGWVGGWGDWKRTDKCLILLCPPRSIETGAIDPEIQRFNTPGFVGCLSGVKFNSIVPFKTIFRRSSKGPTSPYQITGRLVESKCGSMPAMFMQVPPELDPWYTEPGKAVGS